MMLKTKKAISTKSKKKIADFPSDDDNKDLHIKKKIVKSKEKIKLKKKPKAIIPMFKSESNSDNDEEPKIKKKSKKGDKLIKKGKKKAEKKNKGEEKSHIKHLEKLKDIDPEFYKFLKQNDKALLDFNLNDSDDDQESEIDAIAEDKGIDDEHDNSVVNDDASDNEDDDNEDDDFKDDNDNDELVHKPSRNFEVGSDESDFNSEDDEDEDEDTGSKVVTMKLLKKWQSRLQSKHVDIGTIRKVIQAFSSALASLSGKSSKIAVFKVEGAGAFNGVIQLCVLYLQPAVYRYLNLQEKSNIPIHKCKKWKKIQSSFRSYLLDLTNLLEHVSSTNILTVLLKHLHQIAKMVSSFNTISKPILKRLIILWSTSEETVRVLSFLCILKITRDQQVSLLNHVLKAMYISYVRNSKFVSPTTLPGINFMRRSLVEMFALDLNVSYQHVFLYIRQLAIHLRNAIILKKKDSFQAVYNWQFINSVRLWTDLLGATTNKPQFQPLIYPLVSITTGVIKLIPTAQFFPLRFHCIHALITLSKQTNTFIPVLPFILEVLNSNTFNKKHTIVSMKPMQFTCVLRLNKPQMAENGFRDEVLENVFGLTLEYLSHESCTLAFPDLVVPGVVYLKQYLKTCKNSNYTRKLKQLLDKIMENSKFIEQERSKIKFTLKDAALIQSWETKIRNKGTPMATYYTNWVKTSETKRKRQAANTDDINDYYLPSIKRKRVEENGKAKGSKDGPVDLFPSDTEDDDEEQVEVKEIPSKKQKKEKKQKKVSQEPVEIEEEDDFMDNGVDIVKDLDLDDW